jgi:drug/metabolite transporter (DMT)-like permease
LTLALAALAAIGFGASAVGARLGLRDTGIVAGVLIANATAVVILVVVALIDPPPSIRLSATGWFALSGLAGGPGLASVAILLGLRRLGPPTHVPLQGGAYGIAVSLGAAVFLSETVGPRKAVGVAAIVIGAG